MPEHATKRASRGVTCLCRDRDHTQHPIGTLEPTRAVIAPPKTAVTSPNRWIQAKGALTTSTGRHLYARRMPEADDDWRLRGQEKHLSRAALQWQDWWTDRPPDSGGPWDHDHCDFCWQKFAAQAFDGDDPPTLLAGFCTPDGRHWICPDCFSDFHQRFGWTLAGSEHP